MSNHSTRRFIVRLKGGLGNQLFCYAAARRLAYMNNAELILDDVTGFCRDQKFKRQFALGRFNIKARLATPAERMEPFERYRRALAKWRSRLRPFEKRTYLEQEGSDFDPRLLTLMPEGDLYLDGLWASEAYFKDIEAVIRQDLVIQPPADRQNQEMAARILACSDAVALHVRWFEALESSDNIHNDVLGAYYQRAVEYVGSHLGRPHYFLFSDDPFAAAQRLGLPKESYTLIAHNVGGESAYADMWLMSQCRHFITANSTFSWWGTWLSSCDDKLVVTPDPSSLDERNAWRMGGLVPEQWIRL